MKDPTSTRRHSSRQMSTQPLTIPQRSANTTTSPIPPRRHAGPTTTATTAETRPTSGSLTPFPRQCPAQTPSQRHGDVNLFGIARSPAPPQSLPHGRVCVSKGITGTFHQEMWVWKTRPVSRCIWGHPAGVGWGCYYKGYSRVNSELHMGTWWKTSAGQLLASDRMLWASTTLQTNMKRTLWKFKLHSSGCGSPFHAFLSRTAFSACNELSLTIKALRASSAYYHVQNGAQRENNNEGVNSLSSVN